MQLIYTFNIRKKTLKKITILQFRNVIKFITIYAREKQYARRQNYPSNILLLKL